MPAASDSALMRLARAIAADDAGTAARLLAASPDLAKACFADGATRGGDAGYFLDPIKLCLYAGDTALHVAAAAHRTDIVQELIRLGADVRARNRRGAEPLHSAARGDPNLPRWNPPAQTATIAALIAAGADPDAPDASGVAPLHKAVRSRCAAAVQALIAGGADARRRNKSGSTPMLLARQNTGRGGSGSPECKAQQQEIVRLLARAAAT